MKGKTLRILTMMMVMMAIGASLFAAETGSSGDEFITPALNRIASLLSGPVIGALFIGIFAAKMLIAYTKHQSSPQDMKKEVISALIFAGVIVGAVAIIKWLFGEAGGDSAIASNFQSGLGGATISQDFLVQAKAMLTAATL